MKYFSWSPEKNQQLIAERGISFEEVVFHVEQGHVLDLVQHPNQEKYPRQRVFVVDVMKEHIAVAESRRLRLPIGAIIDTNCDPDSVDYPIPGNDDAIKSVVLIARAVADTIIEAGGVVRQEEIEAAAQPAADTNADVADEDGEDEGEGRRRRVVRRRIGSSENAA